MEEAGPRQAAPLAGAPPLAGAIFILLSAAGFGAMAIFGKLAFDAGVTTLTVLLARFVIAATVFWTLLAVGAPGRPAARPAATARLVGVALGAIGYATQAGLF